MILVRAEVGRSISSATENNATKKSSRKFLEDFLFNFYYKIILL
jgi:hypothetical protein